MKNLNIEGQYSSAALQKALSETGCQVMLVDNSLHVEGAPEEELAAETLVASFDLQAGINADVQKIYEAAIQKHLDSEAQAAGYDNVLSAVSYAGYTNPYQTEGQSFLAWRGAVWSYAYEQMGLVLAGTRTKPTPSELVAELPVRAL